MFTLSYREECVAAYIADLVVEDTLILELKSVKALSATMEASGFLANRSARLQTALLTRKC